MYFDRSGAVECAPLNINANAVQLVQVVRMLGDHNLHNLGFDPSIYWEDGRRYVDVMGQLLGAQKASSRKYEIEQVLFQRPLLIDRGTTCWAVKEVGGTESVLMKDTWQDDGRSEKEFLTFANNRGISGVRRLLVVDATRASKPLSISTLRFDQSIPISTHRERTFSRLLLELEGPSIRHFDSGLQLLQGLRDAVDSMFFRSLIVWNDKSDHVHQHIIVLSRPEFFTVISPRTMLCYAKRSVSLDPMLCS